MAVRPRITVPTTRDDRGVTAVEYGLIAALIALLVIPAVLYLTTSTSGAFESTTEADPGVTICADGDPTCTAFDALPAANVPGVPAVVTLAASSVGSTGATLNGTVNAKGTSTAATFCYGTAPDLAGCAVINGSPATVTGNTATAVTASVSSLATNTTYYFRIIGTSAKGTRYGATFSFTTGTAGSSAPTATTTDATAIGSSTANLNGLVVPGGLSTTVTFCYDDKTNLKNCANVPATPATVSGTAGVAVTTALTGLTPGKTYYFRVQAINTLGSDTGNTRSFTAGSGFDPPTAVTVAANPVASTTATLKGLVSGNRDVDANVTFCWGPDSGLTPTCSNGTVETVGSVHKNATNQAVSASVSGLSPGSTYYFQVIATNQGDGTKAYGNILSFTTPTSAPTVATVAASSVSSTSATMNGTVTANGAVTTVTFQRCSNSGMTTGCQTRTATPATVAANGVGVSVAYVESGLTAGQTYYFRVVGNNGTGGDQLGSVSSFITPGPPTVTTVAATSVTTTTAALNGTVTSNGASTTVTFKRCDDAAMATNCVTRTPTPSSVSGVGVAVTYPESGLTAGKRYYFQAIGDNGIGAAQLGSVLDFTTLAALPACTVLPDRTFTVSGAPPYTVNLLPGVTGGVVTGRQASSSPAKTDGTVDVTTPNSANVTWSVTLTGNASKEWNGRIDYTSTACTGVGSRTVKLSKP